MWLRLFLRSLCWSAALSLVQAQSRASFSRFSDPAGGCHYTFTVASPDESGCGRGDAAADVDGVRSRLAVLEALVSRLLAGSDEDNLHAQVMKERSQLRQENERLNQQVQELQRSWTELNQQVESLRQRPCSEAEDRNTPALQKSRFGFGNGTYQEMKAEVRTVPASHLLPERSQNLTGCGELLSLGDPELHSKADSLTGKYGVWMQDPEPRGPRYTNRTVWRIDVVGKDVRRLFVYEDLGWFYRGLPMEVLVLPEPVESTGATMYRGSLYYQRRRSRTLIRYDPALERVVSRRELPDASFHGQQPYSWGGYTDIDLAADEQGLWVIYSTSRARGAIVVSQLDPESLEVKRSWESNIRKNSVANAFMICGRLYTVASYTAPNTTISYVFDTATGAGRATAVPFRNKYGYNSMVDYNHAHRKLYAWDNFHMVTYDISLGRD